MNALLCGKHVLVARRITNWYNINQTTFPIMKSYSSLFFAGILALGLQTTAWSDPPEKDLKEIVRGFSNEDPALQFEARLDLLAYVSYGTSPSQKNGAEKTTKELLGYLRKWGVAHEAKKYIIRDLARVGTSTAVAPLSKLMTGKDELLAELARQALEQIDGKAVSEALKKAIPKARNDTKRRSYIRTLANRAEASNASYFLQGLQSSDALFAHESALALSLLGDADSVEALQNAYLKSSGDMKVLLENEIIRSQTVSEDMLLSIHKNGVVASNRDAALLRLVESNSTGSIDLLKVALLSSNSQVRSNAIRLAMTTGRQSLIKNMGSRISGDNWLVVLGGLSAFENRGAESLALMAFEAGDHHVKVQAIRTLGTYGGSKSVDLLLENFVSGDKQLQQAAAYAIERMPGNAMNGRVQKMLNSESSQDIKLAVSVLAHRNTPYRKNRLFRIIGGEDSELALAALKSISTNVEEEDLYRLLSISKKSDEGKSEVINGLLKKVAPQIGSQEIQARVKNL